MSKHGKGGKGGKGGNMPETTPEGWGGGTAKASENSAQRSEGTPVGFRGLVRRSSITDWLIALFTAVLAAVSIYQFWAIRGQLDTMRKEQRAWVSVTQKTGTTISVGSPPSTVLTVTDTGKTPATDVVCHFYVEIVPNGGTPHFQAPIPHNIMISGVMLPNDPKEITVTRLRQKQGASSGGDFPVSPDEKAELDEGRAWIAVDGVVWYDDVFKVRHWTRFCFHSSLKAGMYPDRSCTTYNEVDSN
jgi:hypothetical protein